MRLSAEYRGDLRWLPSIFSSKIDTAREGHMTLATEEVDQAGTAKGLPLDQEFSDTEGHAGVDHWQSHFRGYLSKMRSSWPWGSPTGYDCGRLLAG